MNAISTLKRSLVISGAALVLAVPAAQAAQQSSEQQPAQAAATVAAPSSEVGLQMQRFQHAATRGPQSAPIVTTQDHVQWINFAIGGLIVALVFSVLYVGVSRTQIPGTPRPQA